MQRRAAGAEPRSRAEFKFWSEKGRWERKDVGSRRNGPEDDVPRPF